MSVTGGRLGTTGQETDRRRVTRAAEPRPHTGFELGTQLFRDFASPPHPEVYRSFKKTKTPGLAGVSEWAVLGSNQ